MHSPFALRRHLHSTALAPGVSTKLFKVSFCSQESIESKRPHAALTFMDMLEDPFLVQPDYERGRRALAVFAAQNDSCSVEGACPRLSQDLLLARMTRNEYAPSSGNRTLRPQLLQGHNHDQPLIGRRRRKQRVAMRNHDDPSKDEE